MAVFSTVFWVLSLVLMWSGCCESKKAGVKESSNGKNAKFTIKLDDVMADLDTFETAASELVQQYGRLQGHCTLVAHDHTPVTERPRSCWNTRDAGVTTIYPDGVTPITVFCDQDTDGGGWTVFQRRQDGSENFYRNWTDYQEGFGDLNNEFWLGLDALNLLTSSQTTELRVDLMMFNGTTGYAVYSNFFIGNSSDNYRLHFDSYTGNTGDSLSEHNNMQFTTPDNDNDLYAFNCAWIRDGAWWYNECSDSNLNGPYRDSRVFGWGVVWLSFDGRHSLKSSEMKLRAV